MKRLALIAALGAFAALPVFSQDEDGGGFLTRLIEDNLSSAGREVRITGFQGALSSRASLREMTIADDDGIWLTLRGATLDWNRGALLRGRLEVTALTADALEVTRRPRPDTSVEVPAPAAGGFSLPELPVSVEIGQLAIASATLGAPVIGVAARLRLEGSVALAGGEGTVSASVERIDDVAGRIALDAGFVNATNDLSLSLDLAEAAGGIAATLLRLPGAPSVALSVQGAGPLSDFGADIRLATDGAERLAGQVTLAGTQDGAQRFAADISGDLAPVFAPEYRPFFGQMIALQAGGARAADGATVLETLSLTTRSLSLSGSAAIAADGLPNRIALTGQIADTTGARVLLPVAGGATSIERAALNLSFDAAQGDSWTALIEVEGLERPDIAARRLALNGTGRILRDPQARSVTATLEFDGSGVRFGDPALENALGDRLTGRADLSWRDGAPLDIAALTLSADGLSLDAAGQLGDFAEGIALTGAATARIASLQPFSALAGRDLGGAAEARVEGSANLLGGAFDITLGASGQDLAFGVARVDPLWRGTSRLDLSARRDAEGTTIERFDIRSDHASGGGSGHLTAEAGELRLSGEILEAGDVIPGARGPARIATEAVLEAGTWTVSGSASGPGALSLSVGGTLSDPQGSGAFDGTVELTAADLAPWSGVARQPLSGGVEARLSGTGAIGTRAFDLALEATGRNLALGMAEIDRLLDGTARLSVAAAGEGSSITIRRAALDTRQITASGTGSFSDSAGAVTLRARLADLGLFTPDIRGPATVEASAVRIPGGWRLSFDGAGPGGVQLRGAGTVDDGFGRANMDLSGRAPLSLANARIAPASAQGTVTFDLRLDGAPGLSALSGRISMADARIVSAAPRIEFNGVSARATLSGGRAQVSASAAVERGGRISIDGPLALSPPFDAALRANLSGVVLADPDLFETIVDAAITVDGPLAGGAAIGGRITLGQTELRIPSSPVTPSGAIPDIIHVGEPAEVRRTRDRAGLLDTGGGTRGAGPAWPLDLLIQAPRRVFIRGRGLDAELGGQLRISGSTAGVVPSGGFQLIRGRLDFLGKRIDLTEGLVDMQGAFLPHLRLLARADAGDTAVFVSVIGPADEPDITFRSDPELPEDEVLARLLFGRGISELSALQAAQLAAGVASLAGYGGLGLLGKLREGAGLADLDVSTSADGNTQVSAGSYIGENIYTGVSVGSEGTELNLNLDLSPSVTARGTVDSKGDTSLGVFFERDY